MLSKSKGSKPPAIGLLGAGFDMLLTEETKASSQPALPDSESSGPLKDSQVVVVVEAEVENSASASLSL